MRLLSQSLSLRPMAAIAVSALLLLLVSLVACGPGSPEEKVTQTRGQYTVELSTWFPKVEEPEPMEDLDITETEAEDPAVEADSIGQDEPSDEVAMEGEDPAVETVAAPVEPSTTTILFDLIVLFSGSEPLEGVTVDITHADASGAEKKTWRRFLETSGIVKAETRQITFEDAVEFTDGDQFSVQLLKYVDPANYSEYKEYAEAQ